MAGIEPRGIPAAARLLLYLHGGGFNYGSLRVYGELCANLARTCNARKVRRVEKFIERTGWHPDRVELIAGALNYSRYNFLIRFVMRSIARKAGGDTDTSRDYEYTDWSAVERFAVGVAEGAEVAGAGFPVPPAQVAPQATAPRAP